MTAIAITGMHRSGTSLVASWMQRSGLPIIGDQAVTATTGNPRGHHEDARFVWLQRAAIIDQLGAGTRGWVVTAPVHLGLPPRRLARAVLLAANRRFHHRIWGWKDPRTTLFLRQWNQLLPDLRVVGIWRPHDEVVDSLLRRASLEGASAEVQVTEDDASSMWTAYNEVLCEWVESHRNQSVVISTGMLTRHPMVAATTVQSLIPEVEIAPLEAVLHPQELASRSTCSGHPLEGRLAALSAVL